MRVPRPPDDEMIKLARRYVTAEHGGNIRYRKLPGSVLYLPDHEAIRFGRALAEDARQISDHDLGVLLDSEWRARLAAAWLIALDRRVRFRERLTPMLLESELVHAGAGYCLALARFGEAEDAAILSAYLDRYLPQVERRYDQDDALGALMLVDDQLGTDHAARFLGPGGLWETFTVNDSDAGGCKRFMQERVSFAESAMNGTLAQWAAQRDRS
ncbi:hypothetical protein Aph01nite_60290 [Acrocarpospora phusangensis]|uniref:Uncharacterized protein n=1 Tax=Acrocarpospora phusangensis TaxID=1070424 RepID=A0A919QEH7_9ACTN|nr:DUF6000 family protein [Acrocarpospora phusangensis]GIH27719.1 hypothetical protein Aph01nite_60290 [Acrocarpospora phusangensis]